jgi:hypothetical protein
MKVSLRLALLLSLSALAAPCVMRVQAENAAADRALFVGGDLSFDEITGALTRAAPRSIKPVGTSSVVFKLDLPGFADAAFKPETKLHPEGHLAEVAAFRLGRTLSIPNVAPAVLRSFPVAELKSWLGSKYKPRWPELEAGMVVRDGKVAGAAIYWIPDMHELGIDGADGMRRWARWLGQDGELPSRDKSRLIAAQISTLVSFDYLIGNWDRFSGANAQGDHSERYVFFRDHNVAFMEPLPSAQHTRVLGRLRKVQRFSTSFVRRLKALDRGAIERATGVSETGALLREAQRRALEERRRTLLSYIAALIDRFGEPNVLTFQ